MAWNSNKWKTDPDFLDWRTIYSNKKNTNSILSDKDLKRIPFNTNERESLKFIKFIKECSDYIYDSNQG